MRVPRRFSHRTILFSVLLGIAVLAGCFTVPETGRQSLVLIDEATEFRLGLEAYTQVKNETPLSTSSKYNRRVSEVGRRIAVVANQPSYDWEFTVFDQSDTVNAWCLPGGKIGIYTGLFKLVKNEDQLAFVTAHEVGHAVAKHGAERMSYQLVLAAGAEAIAATMDSETEEDVKSIEQMKAVYGVGSALFVLLPFSRRDEYEADRIGIMYMADAGYDPREAIKLHESFAAYHGEQGMRMPEYLSTHPSDEKRIARLKELLPQAMQRYYRATGQTPPPGAGFDVPKVGSEELPTAKGNYGQGSTERKHKFTGVKIEEN
jgi:predicted Zn-dependent protease